MYRKMLSIGLALALVFTIVVIDAPVNGSATLHSRAGDFMTGAACGGAVGAIVVLGSVLAGAVTGGVGFIVGTAIGGMIAGAGCDLYNL